MYSSSRDRWARLVSTSLFLIATSVHLLPRRTLDLCVYTPLFLLIFGREDTLRVAV